MLNTLNGLDYSTKINAIFAAIKYPITNTAEDFMQRGSSVKHIKAMGNRKLLVSTKKKENVRF